VESPSYPCSNLASNLLSNLASNLSSNLTCNAPLLLARESTESNTATNFLDVVLSNCELDARGGGPGVSLRLTASVSIRLGGQHRCVSAARHPGICAKGRGLSGVNYFSRSAGATSRCLVDGTDFSEPLRTLELPDAPFIKIVIAIAARCSTMVSCLIPSN
jgi:hypothetical protein